MTKDQKILLVLGGTYASLDVVKQAKKMGLFVIVADDRETGVAKEIADKKFVISTTDTENLLELINKENVDGVFCGPSEGQLVNVMNLCEMANLPFYTNKEEWEICENKAKFKSYCIKHNVPCVPEYYLTEDLRLEDLKKIEYPVVVKPVDSGSSRGISVCHNEEELRIAIPYALSFSKSHKFLVEKYISSKYGFGCRYIVNDGKFYLSAANDRYTVDQNEDGSLISSVAIFPSKRIDEFIKEINPNVIKMFEDIGVKNGTFFMQAMVDRETDNIYFHEMGLRLSGGLIFSMLEATCGINDMQMMIRYALGGEMATKDEINNIDPYLHGYFAGSLTIPLRPGKIGKIIGIEEVKNDSNVTDLFQYYYEGDEITQKHMKTLDQHFCRIKFCTDSLEKLKEEIDWIQKTIFILDEYGEDMIYKRFDLSRLD